MIEQKHNTINPDTVPGGMVNIPVTTGKKAYAGLAGPIMLLPETYSIAVEGFSKEGRHKETHYFLHLCLLSSLSLTGKRTYVKPDKSRRRLLGTFLGPSLQIYEPVGKENLSHFPSHLHSSHLSF